MSCPNDPAAEIRAARLIREGWQPVGQVEFTSKTRCLGEGLRLERWRHAGLSFLLSTGCGRLSCGSNRHEDEYIVQEFDASAAELIEMIVYYSITLRPLLLTDVVAIGKKSGLPPAFTHAFISVPFFLPRDANAIQLEAKVLSLNWIMPINELEAEYVAEHGSDKFEDCLFASNYDFFDLRDDMGYLRRVS